MSGGVKGEGGSEVRVIERVRGEGDRQESSLHIGTIHSQNTNPVLSTKISTHSCCCNNRPTLAQVWGRSRAPWQHTPAVEMCEPEGCVKEREKRVWGECVGGGKGVYEGRGHQVV